MEIKTIIEGDGPLIGEDTADLLQSIENAFGIQFSREGPFPRTVGELCDCVIARFETQKTSRCFSSMAFYWVRRNAVETFRAERKAVTPSTELSSLFSSGRKRRNQWRVLQRQVLPLKLPDLELSTGTEWCIGLMVTCAALAVIAALWQVLPILSWLLSALLTSFVALIVWVIVRNMRPFASQFPRNGRTFGDLIKLTVAHSYGTLVRWANGWSHKEVWGALQQFIADEILLDPAQITPDTLFPDGLGIW